MDRVNSRIAQAYGYIVCLICVVVILISTHQVIDAAFDVANPAAVTANFGGRYGPTTSYKSWRFEARRQSAMRGPAGQVAPDSLPSDADLRKMFDAERTQQLAGVRFRAMRSLVTGIVFIVLATVLFLWHWRWIRGAAREEHPVTP